MIRTSSEIMNKADQIRQRVITALDEIASIARTYPYSSADPLSAIQKLQDVAGDEDAASADALLSAVGQGRPIASGLTSVLEAARPMIAKPAA
jgi:hypothetical protein